MAEWTAAVVIGGGVNRTSTAFQLAKTGLTDVILVERRQFGAGATDSGSDAISLDALCRGQTAERRGRVQPEAADDLVVTRSRIEL